ncbi:hypothetical protein B0H11DRAFT_1922130 [Mycena galericulata]|nr:hypothetical protein B0H11DRAFT_1922130 [Mycena galericulata]
MAPSSSKLPKKPRKLVFQARNLPCLFAGGGQYFVNNSGRTQHANVAHRKFHQRLRSPSPALSPISDSRGNSPNYQGGGDVEPETRAPSLSPEPPLLGIRYHPVLNGTPCDKDGKFLPAGTPPPPRNTGPPDDFAPYADRADFELADLLYRRVQMSAGNIDELMQNWASRAGASDPPFVNHRDLYNTIDATEVGHVPWESFNVSWNGACPAGDETPWKKQEYMVYGGDDRDNREYMDFMSGNWAWRQADIIVQDPATHGVTFVPVILGSDKTIVSVATGQNEYYPLYMSNGLVHNNVRRAHRNAVSLIGFLAIPKTDRENQDTAEFRTFRRNLFHVSLRQILQSLKPGMTTPEVVRYADGHYRRTIYGLGPYIADYPEQVLLACIVQGWCDGEGGHRSNRPVDKAKKTPPSLPPPGNALTHEHYRPEW